MTWILAVDFGTSMTVAAYRVDGGPAQAVRLSDQADQMPPATGLIAEVLILVKNTAMRMAGGQAPQALILTYPQQWAQGRKEVLRQAAAGAGFDPTAVWLVSEPIAAATWYAAAQPVPAGKCIAVVDVGGGTCDVAILRSNPDEPAGFTVLAAEGIDLLGGELQTVVTITIAEVDRIVGGDIDAAVQLTKRTLIAAGVAPIDLHALYLTGGSSQIRLLRRRMTELLGRPPATVNDPKLVVVRGALLVPPAALEPATGGPGNCPVLPNPSGPPPPPLPVPGEPSPRKSKPKWLIPTIAAAVAVVIAAVVIIVAIRGSGTAAHTGTGTSTTTGAVVTSREPEASVETSPPVQYCSDGRTMAASDTCPAKPPTTCWDDTTIVAGLRCPAIAAQAGLEWVFPVPDGWTRTCEPLADKNQYEEGEVEVYRCEVDKLPLAVFYLSRWSSPTAAETALTARYQAPADWKLVDSDDAIGVRWDTDQESADGNGRTNVRIDLYNDHPFSILALFPDPKGVGAQSQTTWEADQLFQYPATIVARSNS